MVAIGPHVVQRAAMSERESSPNPPRRAARARHKVALLLFGLALAEMATRFAVAAGWFVLEDLPVADREEAITFLGDIHPRVGVWHLPNAAVTVETPQGPVGYESNAQGMRDRPRREKSPSAERVAVLGDSFVEGFLVEEKHRVTDLLEAATGVSFLNFGASGDFGSIQAWQAYEHIASRFDHSRVFVFHLPDNDFEDNNPAEHPATRYRPYLRKQAGGFELYYPVPFVKQTQRTLRLGGGRRWRNRFLNAWQTAHLVQQIDFSGLERFFKAKTRDSTYDTYSDADLEVLLFSYERILEKAHPRPVTFFIIPRDKDFVAYADGRHDGRIAAALRDFAKDREQVAIVDLMPAFQAYMREHGVSHEAFFLDFDPHWSPLGHRVAAAAALASLRASSPETWPDPALFFLSP